MSEKQVATVVSRRVICKQPGRYIGWPTIAKTREGELLIVFSGDRDQHICPYGKTFLVRSSDSGETWSDPVLINDTPLDDRDAGIIQTMKGTLLVSWFTSTAFADWAEKLRGYDAYGDEMLDTWKEAIAAVTDGVRDKWLGCWVRRSVDGGRTWDEPIRHTGSAPHGPIQLSDGRLFCLGNATLKGERVITAEVSSDDGKTWQVTGTVPVPNNMAHLSLCEPHVVETNSGKLVGMFRTEPPKMEDRFLYQAESDDGGRTWTEPHKTSIWGYPPHLICLRDGRLLVVYGRRMEPYGERACLSQDGGRTWDVENEIVLSRVPKSDLGYPASAQLDDGTILTIYYEREHPDEKPCLMGTQWKLET